MVSIERVRCVSSQYSIFDRLKHETWFPFPDAVSPWRGRFSRTPKRGVPRGAEGQGRLWLGEEVRCAMTIAVTITNVLYDGGETSACSQRSLPPYRYNVFLGGTLVNWVHLLVRFKHVGWISEGSSFKMSGGTYVLKIRVNQKHFMFELLKL